MVHASSLSHVQLFETPRTVVHQAPLSVEFSRQDHWNGMPFPSPGDLPKAGNIWGTNMRKIRPAVDRVRAGVSGVMEMFFLQ